MAGGVIEPGGPIDVAIVERRPAVREVVTRTLTGEAGFSVVASSPDAAGLHGLTTPYQALVVGEAEEPDDGWSSFAVPVSRLRDDASIAAALSLTSGRTGNAAGSSGDAPTPSRLSPREREVLRGVAGGRPAEEIALRMDITAKSVENHKQRIYAKLGVHSQAEAVLAAQGSGELPAPRNSRREGDDLVVLAGSPSPLLTDVLTGALGPAPGPRVATAATLAEVLDGCDHQDPDLVVSAVRYPDGELSTILKDLLGRGRRVLVMADAADADAVTALLFAGASGCLFWQDASPRHLVAAARDVARGGAALHPLAAAAVLAQWRSTRDADEVSLDPVEDSAGPALTPRESDVLQALSRGLPTKSIGRELAVSPKTVEAHIARLLAKLGVRTRIQAVSAARSRGLL